MTKGLQKFFRLKEANEAWQLNAICELGLNSVPNGKTY